jgi:aspartate/methionine/tyrosine aminotransferase
LLSSSDNNITTDWVINIILGFPNDPIEATPMKIKPFEIERYFAKYEFSAPFLLSSSDCESLSMAELLNTVGLETLKLWEGLKLGYTESQGHPLLREIISSLYKSITPNEVLLITPEEGIFIVMNCLLERGDHVITTFPGYQSLYEIATAIGCRVSRWVPDKENDWDFDLSVLESLVQDNTKMIVINSPHNPTGTVIRPDQVKQILALVEKKGILLFSDEMYRLLEYDDAPSESVSDLYENAVSLFGLSKSFGLAGLRLGWLTTKNDHLMEQFFQYKDYTTICSSAPSEILAIMALEAQDWIIARNKSLIQQNLKLLDKFFVDYKDVVGWVRPKAGPIAFPEFTTSWDIQKTCVDLVEKKGVMLLPSTVFDFHGNHFRLGFGRKNMPEALGRFSEYLDENI